MYPFLFALITTVTFSGFQDAEKLVDKIQNGHVAGAGISVVNRIDDGKSINTTRNDKRRIRHPQKVTNSLGPKLSSKNYIVLDQATKTVLLSKDSRKHVPPASTIKLLTILTVLRNDVKPRRVVHIPESVSENYGGNIGLSKDDEILVEDLINASLIDSSNDAANALMYTISENREDFFQKSKKVLDELNLKDTKMLSLNGVDVDGQYSSAYDLSVIYNEVVKYNVVREAMEKKEASIKILNKNEEKKIQSTNKLLDSFLKIRGGKTGFTERAGECLVLETELGNGRDILSVLLGSSDRFQESKAIHFWVEENFRF